MLKKRRRKKKNNKKQNRKILTQMENTIKNQEQKFDIRK